jgi:polyhydroxyalkanoate synthesis repressor PhaR
VGTDTTPGRLIRRYGNRKLYDTKARRYVTLEDLGRLVEEGEDVRVLEQASGKDVSTVVLAQVVLEGIRERTAEIPRVALERLIRWGTPLKGALLGPQEAAARARDEVQRIVGKLLARGRISLEEAMTLRQDVAEAVQRIVHDAQRSAEDTVRELLVGAVPLTRKKSRTPRRRTRRRKAS